MKSSVLETVEEVLLSAAVQEGSLAELELLLWLQELIGKMLQVKAEARYTAQDILSHPWVTVTHTAACPPTDTDCCSVGIPTLMLQYWNDCFLHCRFQRHSLT